jgi:ATP-binding cassette subfamily C protein
MFDVGSFVVATASLVGLQSAYSEVVNGMANLLPLIPKAQRVAPLLHAKLEVQAGAAPATLEGNVSLRHVTFHYADDDVRVLDNVTVDIKNGEFVAVVGPSGCGKSTFIKMILGFFAPSSGSVLFDGKDLECLDVRSVRRQIGAVLQGSELLPSTIHFNIVGTTGKTHEDAWLAARRACIAEDIEQMPMKMFTVLSDRSVTISGGQKQRILIARALVREPKVLIFDEATSALDNKTQAGVMSAIRDMRCTKICVAHRLSTIVQADRILVMDKGRIVQEGTFDSLMAEDGLFRTLARAQLEASNASEELG